MTRFFYKALWSNSLAFIMALTIYALILIVPIPYEIGLFVRYNLVFLSVISIPFFYLAFKIRGFWGNVLSLGLTLILFGLPLSGLWRSGASEPFIIAGLLPFSDAASYYSDALRVTEGFRFSAFSARRPLFPALLTVLLWLTGLNLMVSLAILGMLIGLVCYLAAREMQRSIGIWPALLFLFVLFLFYRRFSGATMTENLGLPLGILSFVILWVSAQRKNLLQTALGLLLLTLALNARAGTFFILPALAIWSGFAFRGSRKFSLLAAFMNIGAIALGFLLNMMVFKLIADPGGMVFSNFSYTLYGVVAGGKGWMQILIDHPELAQLDDVARSARTYALVFETWKAHPFNIFVGAFKNWFDYLMPRGAGAFGFIRGEDTLSWVNYVVRVLLSLLAAYGLVASWKKRKQEPFTFMLWAAGGIFLSVPFVPPNDSNQMRVYAATVVFLVAFCAIGLRSLQNLLGKKNHELINVMPEKNSPILVLGMGLCLITILGAVFINNIAAHQTLVPIECPTGQRLIITRVAPGSLVQLSDQPEGLVNKRLIIPIKEFEKTFEGYPEMHEGLVEIASNGGIFARPLDLVSLDYPLIFMDQTVGEVKEGVTAFCAVKPANLELERRGWWQVTKRIQILESED